MPLPWEEGGEPDDWSEVLPQHLEFGLAVNEEQTLYVSLGQAGSGYDWDGEIPLEWVEQYMPEELQDQVMEGTFLLERAVEGITVSQIEADLLRRGFQRRRFLYQSREQAIAAESIRAAEDRRIFEALDKLGREKPPGPPPPSAWDRLKREPDF